MASAGRGQYDSDESDEEELYARGDQKTVPKNKVKSNKRDTAKEWNIASNEGESNTSSRTPIHDESSNSQFRYDQQPTSSVAVPKSTSGKKKKSRKTVDEKSVIDDGSHMVDTLSDTTETQPFDSLNKNQPAVATNSSKLKSIFHRESFKNMGKALSGKTHSSNLDPQDENEEQLNQDQQNNKHQSHANPMNWMKDRFRKQNKFEYNEPVQSRSVLHDIEMDEMNLDSPDEGIRTERNNLLTTSPAAMAQARPSSQNNSYGQTLSTTVDVNDVDSMQMNEKERKIYAQKMCMSVALAVILIAGVVLGIILWAMSSFGLAFKILGPTFFGLSLFALVYKMFLTFIWKEDPYEYLQSQFKRINKEKSGPK